MTDQMEHPEQTQAISSTLSAVAVGKLLAEARVQAELSVDDVAARLRLTTRQVNALESGDLDALPGLAFARGFIRNYAKLLQIDAQPLLEAYQSQTSDGMPAKISLHSENIQISGRQRKGWMVYLLASLIVLMAVAAWLAYTDSPAERVQKPVAAAVPQPVQVTPILPTAEAPENTTQTGVPLDLPVPPATPAEPQVPQVPQPVPPQQAAAQSPAPTAAASARLAFTAGEPSWVSVRDRNGQEIFNKTIPAGGKESVAGTPPLSLILGNANSMQVTYNDKPVDLAPHVHANVARLTLE